jgi:hypothetical protein
MSGTKDAVNPHIRLRRDAERTLLEVAKFLNWQPTVAKGDLTTAAAPS